MGKLWKRGKMNRTLLDRLRSDPDFSIREIPSHPKTMKLILDHLSEFPQKLRRPIQDAKEVVERTHDNVPRRQRPRRQARAFDTAVDRLVSHFLFGRHETILYNNTWSGWHGCDSSVDTEDQVELVLRCFPHLARQHSCPGLDSISIDKQPIFFLTSSSEAVSFVPLFAKITGELPSDVLQQLFCNSFRQLQMQQGPCKKLDEACLAVLEELRQLNMITREDLAYMIGHSWKQEGGQNGREFAFVESRLLLVLQDWGQHSLLETCVWNFSRGWGWVGVRQPDVSSSLLVLYFLTNTYYSHQGSRMSECSFERFLGLLIELGMLYYPHKIGFVFHIVEECGNVFQLCCPKKILRMVDRELTRYLKKDNNGDPNRYETKLRRLVIEAATNKDIMLDGVYTLVRRDPLAMVPKFYKTTSTAVV